MNEVDRVAEHLGEALDQLLSAIAVMGCLPSGEPLALDAALSADEDYQEARQALHAALGAVAAIAPDGTGNAAFLDLEAACNGVAASSATVGWRLALRVRAGRAKR